jgi:hypothetical protein
MKAIHLGLVLVLGGLGLSCGPEYHARGVRSAADGERLTVGTVQREIRKGMSGSEVLAALGSPNIVSTDEAGREVWVYDKFATEVVSSGSGWTILGGGAGGGHSGGGLLGGTAGGSSGAASRTQRTLTIVIKFDEAKLVRDFAYHASRF